MTRHEVEKEISNKFFEILKLYKEYEPEGEYLDLTFVTIIGVELTGLIFAYSKMIITLNFSAVMRR